MKFPGAFLLVFFVCVAAGAAGLPPQPADSEKALARAELLVLLSSGEPSADVIALVEQRGIRFEASEAHLATLRDAGADDTLLAAIRSARHVTSAEAVAAADEHRARARDFADAGNWDAATAEYRESLRLDPDAVATRVLLAQTLRAQDKMEAALQELRIATLLAPSDLSARSAYLRLKREVASGAKSADQPPQAKKVWTTDDLGGPSQASSPLGAEIAAATESVAASEESNPQPETPDAEPKPAPAEPPPPPPAAAEKTQCLLALRGPDGGKAESACKEYARKNSSDADAHYFACLAMRANAHADSATGECKKAIDLRPDDPRLHTSLGEAYLAKMDPGSAIGPFEKALRLNPNYAPAHHGLGRAYLAKMDRKASLEHYDKAFRLNRNLPNLYVEYCSLLRETSIMPLGTSYLPDGWTEIYKQCRFRVDRY